MRRPNYGFERAERERVKQAKKQEKLLKRQQERVATHADDSPAKPAAETEPRKD
jgi:hypothetical protein